MSEPVLTVTRQQLAAFIKDPRAIRAFEKVIENANNLLPSDIATLTRLAEESSTDAARAQVSANQAVDSLERIAQSLEILASAPPNQAIQVIDAVTQLLELTALSPAQRQPRMSEVADVLDLSLVAGSLLIYDGTTKIWKSAVLTQGTNVTITNADGSITIATTAEPAITAGTTSQYWRGDKTWQDFATNVRASVLTGLSTATNAVITAADTVLSALGKLQKQISDNLTTLTTHTGNTSNPHSTTAAQVGAEPAITAGTTAQYWRGDKTWQDFATNVRASVLTGLSTATNAVITATDTVLSALGKLQKQISDNLTTLTTHTGASSGVHGVTGSVVGTTDAQSVSNKTLSATVLSDGIMKSTKTTVVSALSTATSLPGTEAFSGVLRIRDQTLGGAACFIVDPNGGVQTLGLNQITGLTISFNAGLSYVIQATLTIGAVPRTLEWSIFGGL